MKKLFAVYNSPFTMRLPFTIHRLPSKRDQRKHTENGSWKGENGSRGDTIVEVMASIAVLGLALGAAFGLSNRAFNTAVHTHDRIEALALAEGQVEFLKDKGLSGNISIFIIGITNSSDTFCFNDEDGIKITNFGSTGPSCTDYKGSIYTLTISYCAIGETGCGEQNVFTIKASWIAGGSGQNKQLTVFYKPQS